MISWIVASHIETVLQEHLLSTLKPAPTDELVIVRDAPSITLAYAEGQARATQPIRCYVHADVRVLDTPRLRAELAEATRTAGIVGVFGGRDAVFPYWNGRLCGSVVDARPGFGLLDHGPGGECAIVDGLLMATRHTIEWDIHAPGWHGYDHDACSQMLARGLTNWCLTGCGSYIEHHAEPAKDRSTGWAEAARWWRERWGTSHAE